MYLSFIMTFSSFFFNKNPLSFFYLEFIDQEKDGREAYKSANPTPFLFSSDLRNAMSHANQRGEAHTSMGPLNHLVSNRSSKS